MIHHAECHQGQPQPSDDARKSRRPYGLDFIWSYQEEELKNVARKCTCIQTQTQTQTRTQTQRYTVAHVVTYLSTPGDGVSAENTHDVCCLHACISLLLKPPRLKQSVTHVFASLRLPPFCPLCVCVNVCSRTHRAWKTQTHRNNRQQRTRDV